MPKTIQDEMNALVVNPDEMEKQRLKRDVARAEARSKQMLNERKKSPKGIYVSPTVNQYREELERRYLPGSFAAVPLDKMFRRGKTSDGKPYSVMMPEYKGIFKPGATEHGFWDSKEHYNRSIERGYRPVLDEDGQHVNDGNGDYLFSCPIELVRDRITAADQLSRERIRQQDEQMRAAVAEGAGGVEVLDGDVTEMSEQSTP